MRAGAFAREICYIAGMQPIARRLIVVGAVILCGAGAGIALGDFAAGPGERRLPGVEEAMGLASDLVTPDEPAAAHASFAAGSAPASYSCEGCDAKLHNEAALDDGMLADVEPLPPYRPEQAALVQSAVPVPVPAAPPRVQVPAITLPVGGTGAGPASPSSSGTSEVLQPVR